MMQQVLNQKQADVKFQTSYVLFVLSCFLCPTTKDVVDTKFYPAVHNLLQTCTYAWAEFVLDWLANEIVKYKKRSGKIVGGKKDSVGVAGCVLLLMVGSEGEPLIQSWTTKLIKERITKEETSELVDPISERFPEASYRHPMGDVHMDVENFSSTSTVNPKKVRHGIDVEDIDGSRMSGLLFAKEMPLYSSDHVMTDVVQHAQHVELQEEILFLPVLLTDIEYWYCVVVNLVDKRIEVLYSIMLKTTDKKVTTVIVLMKYWMGGRMNTRELEDHVGADAIDVRKRLLVRLLLSPHNQLRDVVLTKLVK
ncbi:hypothetical protein RHSIM_Rhsim01G0162700 [Rhododendron simsii]|uniref:Ubiquitin-like protease family profile domain-containing protein n=1 Tax=Rhododendron simsii TaxID=118357 RepID=A0A834LZX1_RHOSS|nr:hypothetical protein RHSIM_Rhsim01G0162700 [Rhododendron simsii]